MVGKKCNLPTFCPCGSKFDIQNNMSCKKGGFIYIRHNDLRDLTANMMSEMYKDTKTEPKLKPLSGEELQGRTSNNWNKAKSRYQDSRFLGTRATGIFWPKCFRPQRLQFSQQIPEGVPCLNKQEKKRAYNERILQIDHGAFTPLVFSINVSMGREYQKFYSRLAQMISEKRELPQLFSSNWIWTRVCFWSLKSSLLCLRGLRTVC